MHYGAQLQTAGFADQQWAVVLDTDPRAVLTHEPLQLCPAGTVNLYGHLHGEEDRSDRYANVTVERTGYRPVRPRSTWGPPILTMVWV